MTVDATPVYQVFTVTRETAGEVYPISFPYIAPEYVKCYFAVGKEQTVLEYGRDYTINAQNNELTVLVALPVDAQFVVYRVTDLTQEIRWVDGQAVYTPDIMQADDKAMHILQELAEQTNRAVKITREAEAAGVIPEDRWEEIEEKHKEVLEARDETVSAKDETLEARDTALEIIGNAKQDALGAIANDKADAQNAIANDRQAAENSIDSHRTSAEQSIEIMRQSTLQAVSDEGAHYVQLAKNEADRSGTEADRAEDAADRASALADVGIASADKLGLIRIGRGLDIDSNGIVSVRSSITMLAPIVNAPDNLPLGYPATFTMSAYPGLGNTSIVKYRCTLEGLGTVEVDAEPETGAGEVSFTVPRPVGAGVSKKLTVIAIDSLGNESLPTELTRTTVGASVNAPVILTPTENTDVYSSAGFDVTAGEFSTTGTEDTHASTDWLIAKDAAGAVFIVQELESSDLTSHTFTPEVLANRLEDDTTYYLFARYNGAVLQGSALSAPVAIVARGAFVHAPEVTSPEAFSDVYSAAGFSMATTSDFETTGVEDTHASSDWLVATDRYGRNVVASALNSPDLKEHTFSAEDLTNVPTNQTVYLLCRFNGALLGKGVLSAGVEVVCKPAGVLAPEITSPTEGTSVAYARGITIATGEFQTVGMDDTHASTDWKITRDAAGSDIFVEAIESFDLTSHTFSAEELTGMLGEETYYAWARHRGTTLGASPWVNVGFVTIEGIVTPSGRFMYRHSTDQGSVIKFEHFGYKCSMLVLDAKYRHDSKIMTSSGDGTDNPDLQYYSGKNSNGNWYIDGAGGDIPHTSVSTRHVTDTQLMSLWPFLATDVSARTNTTSWVTRYSDAEACKHCRAITSIDGFSDGFDLPTEWELMILFDEAENIDELDPTASQYPHLKLGYTKTKGSSSSAAGRFYFGNGMACSSTEEDNYYCRSVKYTGYCTYVRKHDAAGVLPIRELSREPIVYEFAGRKIWRHESGKGSVIEYTNLFGITKHILVPDAVYRGTAKWRNTAAAVSGLKQWNHYYYPTCTGNVIDSNTGYVDLSQVADLTPYSAQLSDTHFQQALTATLASVIQTAKEATDLMIANGNCPAAQFVRGKTSAVGIEMQLPNIYQTLVMFACGDVIDILDPTLAANPTYALGWYGGVNTYRWYFGGGYYAWASTEASAANACSMDFSGGALYISKAGTRGVVPVAELD